MSLPVIEAESYPNRDTGDEMYRKLLVLQPSLGTLLDQAANFFEEVAPQAPTPLDRGDTPFYYTCATNDRSTDPLTGELTVLFGEGRWIKYFSTGRDFAPAYPIRMFWNVEPHEGGPLFEKTNIRELLHESTTARSIPYDIEIPLIDRSGRVEGSIGQPYTDVDKYVDKAGQAIAEARILIASYI